MIIDELELLEQESIARGIPIIGEAKARWLHETIEKINAKEILELGTANGYSGLVLASVCNKLITIEQDKKILTEAQQHFRNFGLKPVTICGDGETVVEQLASDKENHGRFDVIFIDFAKKKYLAVLENCIKLVNIGGLIIADNVTFENCQDYREAVLNHKQLKTEIIDIGNDALSKSERLH